MLSRSSWGKKKSVMLKAGKTGRYYFTLHSEYKMREYHLSRQRVIRIIRSPKRTETGIVENTIAVMQPASTKQVNGKETWTQELWVMYRVNSESKLSKSTLAQIMNQSELKIISAWRYPGVSPKRDPIPADILREITNRVDQDDEMA
ncbi:MAG: hypothetical protein E6R05_06940 [Candidatus Moraniibacteriota bacterium]|nr:MAG: hypothetical protein E6R05_06940 [Candidatus Moranbacteria bacterium]